MKNMIFLSFLMMIVFTSVSFAEVHRTRATDHYDWSACRPAENGTFWVASNESDKDIWKIDFDTGNKMETFTLIKKHGDIESMAPDRSGGFFVATSLSRKENNVEPKKKRKRVTHVDSKGTQVTLEDVRTQLENKYYFIREVSDKKSKKGGLDVEGIAYNHKTDTLWFGLRGPRVKIKGKKRAVLIPLNNALKNWNNTTYDWGIPIALDLNKRGIRDLYLDIDNDRLLILAGQMGGNPNNSAPKSILVELDLNTTLNTDPYINQDTGEVFRIGKVRHIKYIPQVDLKSAAEGICPIALDGKTELLLVYDSGKEGIYQVAVRHVFYDFDSDEKADIGVYPQDDENWYIRNGSNGKMLHLDPNNQNVTIHWGWRYTKLQQLKTIFGY